MGEEIEVEEKRREVQKMLRRNRRRMQATSRASSENPDHCLSVSTAPCSPRASRASLERVSTLTSTPTSPGESVVVSGGVVPRALDVDRKKPCLPPSPCRRYRLF